MFATIKVKNNNKYFIQMRMGIKIFYSIDDNFKTDAIISFQNAHIYNRPKIIYTLYTYYDEKI